jgi:site-specific DNA-cytosine methylase
MSESETSNGSTLSAADSPAKTSATPDDAPESLRDSTARDSGESSNESFASYDPDSCSWRTSQHSLFGGLTLYSQTWPRSGSMRNGSAVRRPTLVPLTAEIGSGLWATPVANRSIGCTISAAQREAERLGSSRWTLMTQIATLPTPTASSRTMQDMEQAKFAGDDPRRPKYSEAWPTPTAADSQRKGTYARGNPTLGTAVQWPTPTASDGGSNNKSKAVTERGHGTNLEGAVKMYPTPNARDWKDTPGMTAKRSNGRERLDQLPRVIHREEQQRQWPTPRAMDAEKVPSGHRETDDSLNASVARAENMQVSATGQLNPTHMDRLAGVPLLPASPHPKRKAAGRVHRLKALGNAVVPQAGEWIGWQIRRAIGDV